MNMGNEDLTFSEWIQKLADVDSDEVQRLYDTERPTEGKSSLLKKIFGYKKASIPDDFRWAVFERDNFTCKHCGSRRNLTVDHIRPESKGGALTMDNAQTLCKSCNSRKGAR